MTMQHTEKRTIRNQLPFPDINARTFRTEKYTNKHFNIDIIFVKIRQQIGDNGTSSRSPRANCEIDR